MLISILLTAVLNVSKNFSQKGFAPTSMVGLIHLIRLLQTNYLSFLCHLDITRGKENVRVSCVNSIECVDPPSVGYTTERIPRKGVVINTEAEFLVCCDCKDDCQNKEKCQCWQLTIQVIN